MQPTIQTSIPTISSVRRTADCLCAHGSVDVVMGSDFTRYCARLVIRIARSPSPVQRAAVSSYDFVVYVIVNIHNKVGERDEGRACT